MIAAHRPITAARTVLPVLAETVDNHGQAWKRVRLPGRVLGRRRPPPTAWISTRQTLRSMTPWHIILDTHKRRLALYRGGQPIHSYAAVIGKPSTPTPLGKYFVEENVRLSDRQPGGPFALATSARSDVLQEFDGGPGQIAIHGRRNLGGVLGSAASHGCIRLDDRAITQLARRIRPGVPVTIR